MATRNFSSSAAQTSLSAGISSANTSIQVASTTGFPAAPFILALDAGASAQELVLVTNVAGTTLTVTRGYDSTVATTHDAGATVVHSHGAIDFREANTHVNATTNVHGITGSAVGTTDTQTLTNKTLDAPVATGSLTGLGGAWTAWTPTVTASAGAFTTASGTGRYEQRGKTVSWKATITITTVGTASGYVLFTLPTAAQASLGHIGNGHTLAPVAAMSTQAFLASASQGKASRYDDTTVIGPGHVLYLSGTYEAA